MNVCALAIVLSAAVLAQPVAQSQSTSSDQPALSSATTNKPADKQQFEQWRREIKHALFIPDSLPAIAARSYGTFSPVSGVVAERVTYATLYGMRVPAIVYRPAKFYKKESQQETLPPRLNSC
jgi:hypothetical protein